MYDSIEIFFCVFLFCFARHTKGHLSVHFDGHFCRSTIHIMLTLSLVSQILVHIVNSRNKLICSRIQKTSKICAFYHMFTVLTEFKLIIESICVQKISTHIFLFATLKWTDYFSFFSCHLFTNTSILCTIFNISYARIFHSQNEK